MTPTTSTRPVGAHAARAWPVAMRPTRLALSGLVAGFLSVVVAPVATTPGAAAAEAVPCVAAGVAECGSSRSRKVRVERR